MAAKIKKTVIITGYTCNNKCCFCLDEDKRRQFRDKPTGQIRQEIYEARQGGSTYLELIGGESLIRPDIIDLVRFASSLDFDTINIATNGRMLAYEDFAQKLVRAGVTDIIFSLHGHDAELHDSLTRVPGSFDQLLQGFHNLVRYLGVDRIGTNTTIVKQNYQYLRSIGALIRDLGIRNSEFIFVDPTTGAPYNFFHTYVPRISQAAPYIRELLDIGKQGRIPHWHIRYVPLCHFTDYLDQVSELQEVATFNSEHLGPEFQNYDAEGSRMHISRQKAEQCRDCSLNSRCEGIWKEYVRHYGDQELKPIV